MARRTLLGTRGSLGSRSRVYLAADAIEVDEIEGYSGTRKRVLLDEVTLVTIDRRRNAVALGLLAICEVIVLVIFAMSAQSLEGGVLLAAALVSSLFVVPFVMHAALGTDYVTVFGKRTTAIMAFMFRKAKARRTFNELCERIAQAQAQPAKQTA